MASLCTADELYCITYKRVFSSFVESKSLSLGVLLKAFLYCVFVSLSNFKSKVCGDKASSHLNRMEGGGAGEGVRDGDLFCAASTTSWTKQTNCETKSELGQFMSLTGN